MKHPFLMIAFFLGWMAGPAAVADSPIRPGDRIAIVGNTFADQLRSHGYLETRLFQQTRGNPVSIRNLGWGGDMLTARDRPTNFPSEASTLSAHQTDVIVACFGMGESFGGMQGLDDFKRNLQAFIESHAGKTYNGESEVRLILVSPIACEDLGELTPARSRRNQELAAYTRAMADVATAEGIPFVDLFEPSRYLMDEPTGPHLTNNGIHLNRYGYWALSRTFADQLITGDQSTDHQPWQLTIDAGAKTGEAQGVVVSHVTLDDTGLTFRVTETSAPSLPPPTDRPLPPQLEINRDRLVVDKLAPGNYELTVDGLPVITADARSWAEGVAVDSSPAHQAAEEFRAAVNDKNLQFTYSWKALNQVHIVGERRSSPSGKALPEEIIEFNRLARERDEALRRGIELRTRHWRLSRLSR